MRYVIDVKNARKQFGPVKALDGLSWTVTPGQIVAILGPNGAGKTTLLEVLEGLQQLDSGEAWVLGYNVRSAGRSVKDRIGISLQNTAFFDRLSVEETLHLFGSFFSRHHDIPALLKATGLWERRREHVERLSGGQKQRVALALALVNGPSLIFLDEPTTGLDPAARREIWSLVQGMRRRGRSVILTTHYMEEAAYLADTVVIMDHGQILVEGTAEQLLREYSPEQTLVLEGDGLEYLMAPPWNFIQVNQQLIWRVLNAADHLERLLAFIRKHGGIIRHVGIQEATLEDVFLHLTGRRLGR